MGKNRQRKKILYLDHAPYEGGAEVSLKQLLLSLNQDFYELVLVAPKYAFYVQEIAAQSNVKLVDFTYHWQSYKLLFPLLLDLWRLVKTIRHEKPQIIHTNTRVTNLLGGILKCINKFLIFNFEFLILNHVRDCDPLPFWKFKLVNNADLLIANSNRVKDFLIRGRITEKKIHVVYNGVDLKKFDPKRIKVENFRDKLRLKKEDKIVLSIGQIYPRKGFMFLIQAMVRILKDVPETKLLIVGKDPTPDEVHKRKLEELISKLRLGNAVVFLGYRTDIPKLLKLCDLFVLPSTQEPFGRVLIEAGAMEKTVVATNVGGISEIVKNQQSGILVEPKKKEPLAEAIIKLLQNDKMRAEFGQKGCQIAQQKFALVHHVRKIEKIYQDYLRKL